MPRSKGTNVGQNREPEGVDKSLFTCLVAQNLLCNQCPRPATDKGEEMQRLLGDSPATRYCCRLVERVRQERKETQPKIGKKYRRRITPTPDYEGIDSNKGWDS